MHIGMLTMWITLSFNKTKPIYFCLMWHFLNLLCHCTDFMTAPLTSPELVFWGTNVKIPRVNKSGYLSFHPVSSQFTPPHSTRTPIALWPWILCPHSLKLSLPILTMAFTIPPFDICWAVPGHVIGLASQQWMNGLLTTWLLVFTSEKEATCCPERISRVFSFIRMNSRLLPKQMRKVIIFPQWVLRLAEK